jgi:uncharacterized membrane protein
MTTLAEQAHGNARAEFFGPEEGPPQNISSTERVVSLVGGGALALGGLSRRSLPGLVLAGVGLAMVKRGATGWCDLYGALGINTSGQPARPEEYFERGIHVEESVTINKSPEELFQFWRNFENLPRIMSHLEEVKVLDKNKSHWTAKAPAGMTVEWDAEIINEETNSVIAWRSLEGADVDNAGSVRFLPALGDRGTQVKVVLDYIPPAGRLGASIARLFGEAPQQQIHEDLRNFKRILETGEVPTTQGQTQGACMKPQPA